LIHVYTDGGCSGNPGPGGWAYVIIRNSAQSAAGPLSQAENCGSEISTTNNRMELKAVIAALEAVSPEVSGAEEVIVHTDSQYVQKGITEWIHTWKRNAWRTSDKKPVKNQDLWMQLDALAAGLSVTWVWVKGHAGHEYNERCDFLVKKTIASLQ